MALDPPSSQEGGDDVRRRARSMTPDSKNKSTCTMTPGGGHQDFFAQMTSPRRMTPREARYARRSGVFVEAQTSPEKISKARSQSQPRSPSRARSMSRPRSASRARSRSRPREASTPNALPPAELQAEQNPSRCESPVAKDESPRRESPERAAKARRKSTVAKDESPRRKSPGRVAKARRKSTVAKEESPRRESPGRAAKARHKSLRFKS